MQAHHSSKYVYSLEINDSLLNRSHQRIHEAKEEAATPAPQRAAKVQELHRKLRVRLTLQSPLTTF